MNKLLLTAILLGSFCCLTATADDPAPAEKGLNEDGPEVVQADPEKKTDEAGPGQKSPAGDEADLQKQIADLKTEIESLQSTVQKMAAVEKEVERLNGKLATVEGELAAQIKTLEQENTSFANRVKRLEGDNATLLEQLGNREADGSKTQVTAKPGFVKSAVRFHNNEGRPLRINVNGVWHTLKEGQNDIWVPYGPVHIYRYTGAEPKVFWENWKPYQDGYVMEFDVGTPQ